MSVDGAARIELETVVKRFGSVVAVDGVSFAVKQGEILGLLGPSGCGKTTLLRSIAGLDRLDGGRISLNGKVVSSPSENVFVPPEKRRLGFVFQNYALWPHMTVEQNIAYVLRGLSKEEKAKRIARTLELVGLADVGKRYPAQLSGGQQQRVALARSVSYEPDVMLLDEPLSNLDLKERERVREELRSLLKRIGMTTVFVTHDQDEAFVICDRVIVLNKGRIEQEGSPEQLYATPANVFVADFVGRGNILKAELKSVDAAAHRAVVTIPSMSADLTVEYDGHFPDKVTAVVIRRNEIGLSRERKARYKDNVLKGNVVSREYRGSVTDHRIKIGNAEIVATTHKFCEDSETGESESFFVHIPPAAIRPLPS